MTGFRGLRLAREGDAERLMAFCREAHADNGVGSLDEDEVRSVIEQACRRERYVFAIADGPERIEAAIGLKPAKVWYCGDDGWFWDELLVFVHPEHRRSRHAFRLLQFAQWWSRNTGHRVVLNVGPRTGLAEKTALFGRFGKIVGTSVLITG